MTDIAKTGEPPAWERSFIAAGRVHGPARADHVRIALLHERRPGAGELARLYEHGSAAERKAILIALPVLGLPPGEVLPLVHDALRSHDTALVAAALGPFAAAHLDAHTWRHALLKCLFTGMPVDWVAEWRRRSRGDLELARMLRDYAKERTAAGRPVPGDLNRVLAVASQTSPPVPES
jgi:hypothetical protein